MSLDRPEIAALTAELAALRRRVRTLTRALTASIALAAGAEIGRAHV